MKANTPPTATVQVDPEVRDAETWAYIPAFAERRIGAGLERQRHPALEATLDANPQFWTLAFRNGSVSIYQRAAAR